MPSSAEWAWMESTGSYTPAATPGYSMGGAFDTGFDLLDGLIGGYFQFEQQKTGLELQQAQAQQQRLQNTVALQDQINQQAQARQQTSDAITVGGVTLNKTVLLLAAAAVGGLALSKLAR